MDNVANINSTTTVHLPRINKASKVEKGIPDGYMSLDEFGEMFHRKLDNAYKKLQVDSE